MSAAAADSRPQWPRLWVAAGIAVFVAFGAFVLTRTRPPFYDEQLHLAQAVALPHATSFRAWLLANDTSATGPLFALMHDALALGQGALPTPWFRLPNLVLLGVIVVLLAAQLRRSGLAHPWAGALTALAMPTTWVLSGLALTEMPAQCGMAIACWAALRLGRTERDGWREAVVLALGVVVATTGRQTYVAALPAALLLAAGNRRSCAIAVGAIGVGLLPLVALVLVWGGLTPPKMAYMGGGGFRFEHIFDALAYVGVMAALLAPGYFFARWKLVGAIAAAAAAGNLALAVVTFTTLTSVQRLAGHPALMHVLESGAGVVFVAAGVGFLAATLLEAWERRDRRFVANAAGVLGLCAACGAVTALFSSRYVGMTLVFLVPLLAPWIRFSWWSILRFLAGAALGAAALYSYYRFG